MDKIEIVVDEDKIKGTIHETVLITKDDGSQISMLKSAFDEQQAEQSTPNLPGNADKL